MTRYLHSDFVTNSSDDYKRLFSELKNRIGGHLPLTDTTTLHGVLSICFGNFSSAFTAKKKCDDEQLLSSTITTAKDGFVRDIALELTSARGWVLESFDGASLLSLLKRCYPKQTKAPQIPWKVEKRERERTLRIRRRKSGSD